MKRSIMILLGALSSIAPAEGLLPCQLMTDKWLIYNPYTACLSNYLELSGRTLFDKERSRSENAILAELYGSAALGHWASLHIRGAYTRQSNPDSRAIAEYKRSEQLFLQLGHPVADQFYASVGRLNAPFGLNHDLFRLALPSRSNGLWLSSVQGGRIGLGSREGLRIEFGTSKLDQRDPFAGEAGIIVSGRIIRTIDLLDGARLMASYASSSDYSQRRMGLATLVHNEENRTSLEWIRLTEASIPNQFDQVFRFVHEQQQKSWSWVLAMEDRRRNSYRLSFGANRPWIYGLIGTLSLHYQKEISEPRDHWVTIAGLGVGRAWVWEEQDP